HRRLRHRRRRPRRLRRRREPLPEHHAPLRRPAEVGRARAVPPPPPPPHRPPPRHEGRRPRRRRRPRTRRAGCPPERLQDRHQQLLRQPLLRPRPLQRLRRGRPRGDHRAGPPPPHHPPHPRRR